MLQIFGSQYATTRVQGVFLDKGSGKKYCVKWTNLGEDLACGYGANHTLFRDLSEVEAQKGSKKAIQSAVVPSSDRIAAPVINENHVSALNPSDTEELSEDDGELKFPGINYVCVGGNVWRHYSALDGLDPQMGTPLLIQNASICFPVHDSISQSWRCALRSSMCRTVHA